VIKARKHLVLSLPPIDGATATSLFDLCGQLQAALLSDYGDDMEIHWTAAEPAEPAEPAEHLYGPLQPRTRRRAKSRKLP
jgi:hypothetical protein